MVSRSGLRVTAPCRGSVAICVVGGRIVFRALARPRCPPCQTSCRLVMIFNFGAIRNKYGTLRRDIEEQSSCKVVTA